MIAIPLNRFLGLALASASLLTFGCSSNEGSSRLSVLSYTQAQTDECGQCWKVFLDCQADDGTTLDGCEESIVMCATGQTDELCQMDPTPEEGLHCLAGYEACTATGEALGIDVRFDCSQGLQACLWASNPGPCDGIAYPAEDGIVADGCSECDMIQWELEQCYLDGGFPMPEPQPQPDTPPSTDTDPPRDSSGSDESGSSEGIPVDPNPNHCLELEERYFEICVGSPPCLTVCVTAPECEQGEDKYVGDDGQEHECGDVGYCYSDCGDVVDPVEPPPICLDCMTCDGQEPGTTMPDGTSCEELDLERCAAECGC